MKLYTYKNTTGLNSIKTQINVANKHYTLVAHANVCSYHRSSLQLNMLLLTVYKRRPTYYVKLKMMAAGIELLRIINSIARSPSSHNPTVNCPARRHFRLKSIPRAMLFRRDSYRDNNLCCAEGVARTFFAHTKSINQKQYIICVAHLYWLAFGCLFVRNDPFLSEGHTHRDKKKSIRNQNASLDTSWRRVDCKYPSILNMNMIYDIIVSLFMPVSVLVCVFVTVWQFHYYYFVRLLSA